jgi:hypothetical protein
MGAGGSPHGSVIADAAQTCWGTIGTARAQQPSNLPRVKAGRGQPCSSSTTLRMPTRYSQISQPFGSMSACEMRPAPMRF